ncbi:hypothetical protein BH10PSE12_BH10PSE12_01870 [soil metagenome]
MKSVILAMPTKVEGLPQFAIGAPIIVSDGEAGRLKGEGLLVGEPEDVSFGEVEPTNQEMPTPKSPARKSKVQKEISE